MDLSIVIPAHNEDKNIPILYSELKSVLKSLKKNYEIIFIDDGSTDNTFNILENINKKDKKVRVIKFRKKFGQTAALSGGFKASKGNILIVMDADLQNDPKDIPRLLSKMKQGYDVVSGWRYKRKDPLSKKIASFFSNSLIRLITGENIKDSGCSLKAYKKECVKDLDIYGEMHRFIPSILAWKGYKIGKLAVDHRERKHCRTKYGIDRIIKGFLDLLVLKFWMQYSTRPIHLFGSLGILSFTIGLIIGAYLSITKLFFGAALSNRPLLFLAMLLILLGALFFLFGLLADIMVKVYYKDKPTYSIKKIL